MKWINKHFKLYSWKIYFTIFPTRCHFCENTYWLEFIFKKHIPDKYPKNCYKCSSCNNRIKDDSECNNIHYGLECTYM